LIVNFVPTTSLCQFHFCKTIPTFKKTKTMKLFTATAVCMAMLLACNNDKAKAPETKVAAATTDKPSESATVVLPDPVAMEKAWIEFATPGTEHKMMADWKGTWEGDVTDFMNPSAPQQSKATMVNKMIMDGRYQQGTFKGSFGGQSFEGMSLLGYDNARKVFVSTWIDNMGTGVIKMEGQWDEATKSMTLKGMQTDPVTKKECPTREVYKVVDNNNHVMEMYNTGADGKETKMMEIKFKRKSA
jgi:hypothetical protein